MNENQQSGPAAFCGVPPQLRELLHQREDVCRELEALPGRTDLTDYPGEITRLSEKFAGLPAIPEEYAEVINSEFTKALTKANAAAEEFARRQAEREEKNAEALKLRQELEALNAAGALASLSEVVKLEQRWIECLKSADAAKVDAVGFNALLEPLKTRLIAEAEAEKQRSEIAISLGEELKSLLDFEDYNLISQRKTAIEQKFSAIGGSLPRYAFDRYQEQHKAVGAKLSEHYKTLDLARHESFVLKQDLCVELEKMQNIEEKDLPKAAKKLQELRNKWKTLGAVPKEKNEEINTRYLTVTRALQHRIDEYYAKLRQQQKNAVEAKKALCDKVAALQDSTEWNATAALFKEAQAQWKSIPHAGNQEKALFAAFRTCADKFFNARSAWLDERGRKFEAAAEIKNKLIAEAEALDQAAGEYAFRKARQLRSDYQAADRAGRAEAELSARFNAAMDKFFAARREVFNEKENQSRTLIEELNHLAGSITDPAAAEARARTIRKELSELGCRNTRAAEEKAGTAFDKALNLSRKQILADKYTFFKTAAPAAAAAIEAVLAGNAPESGAEEPFAAFPKLAHAVELAKAAAAGDAKAAEKLRKQQETAKQEWERIVGTLEDLVGVKSAPKDDAASLAAELEAAIAGNWGTEAMKKSVSAAADPKQLLSDLFAAGVPETEYLTQALERFDQAYGQLR